MMARPVRISALVAWLAVLSLGWTGVAARTTDCFADDVIAYVAAFSPPESGQRVPELPGIVTGPPGDSFPTTGSVSTVSLGHGGWILLAFTDNVIVDGPGPDFIVFENAFFKSVVPADPNQSYNVFAEPGTVAVSSDGVTFFEYPYDANALALVGQDQTPSTVLPRLRGLAGITPTFTGNYTIPDDPNVWDPNGPGGVSGAGGDAFDLAAVGLASARYVLITDLDLGTGFAGAAEGFDLDSVVALNSIPMPRSPSGPIDSDGDGLSDSDETIWYQSDPQQTDTDGDGASDGVEASRCRSPISASQAPVFSGEMDLIVEQAQTGAGTLVKWSFVSSSSTYDVVRGDLPAGGGPLPSTVVCVENNSFNLTSSDHLDAVSPLPGRGFFYLARASGQTSYGRASSGAQRLFTAGDCAP
ncbi:MAG TPA: hypothetical protein VFG76_03595 [Candidatus Polarisedimenticolia bacterium]|nr:hypothetical protein [Candidatus Polarisedimenticolia bacterium]